MNPTKLRKKELNVMRFSWERKFPNIKKVLVFIVYKYIIIIKNVLAFADPKGSPNPLCNFYVWQFKLCQEYGFRDHANELRNCVTSTQNLYDNPDDFHKILDFLLHLKNIPSKDENKLVCTITFPFIIKIGTIPNNEI